MSTSPPDITSILAGQPAQAPPDLGQPSSNLPMLAPQNQPQAPPTQPPLAPQNQPPKPRPILLDLIKGMVNPTAQDMAGQRPTSRTNVFEQFLGQFLPALSAGFSQARGPGAGLRGAGAAITEPYQQSLQRYQLQQQAQEQQARIAQQQTATQFQQEQATIQPRFDPQTGQFLGAMSQKGFEGYIAQRDKGAAAAQVGAKAKIETEQLKLMAATGQIARVETDKDGNRLAYNRYNQPLGQLDGAIDTKFLNKYSNSVQYMDDGKGNIIALPKTTESGIVGGLNNRTAPTLPVQGPQAGTAASPGAGGGPRVVAQGKSSTQMMQSSDGTMAGTPAELQSAGVSNMSKMDAGDSSKVLVARQLTNPGGLFDLASQDLAQFQPGELNILNSRWQEFMAGKVGSGDPRFVALRTHLNLLSTAMMQAHVGAKGGEAFMEHFEGLANAKKMDAPTLQAALAAEKKYVDEKAMRVKATSVPDSIKKGHPVFDPLAIR